VGVLQELEDPLPTALLRPAAETLPDAVPVAEALWQVAPGGSGLGEPQHGVDEQAGVLGGDARGAGPARQQVLDALEVLVADGVARRHGFPSCGCPRHHYSSRRRLSTRPNPDMMEFVAITNIKADEEITINYNGDPTDGSPVGFPVCD